MNIVLRRMGEHFVILTANVILGSVANMLVWSQTDWVRMSVSVSLACSGAISRGLLKEDRESTRESSGEFSEECSGKFSGEC